MEKFLSELFALMIEEEKSKLKTQQLRVKMLEKLKARFPKVLRDLNSAPRYRRRVVLRARRRRRVSLPGGLIPTSDKVH
jgi:hypothetical protein